MAQRRARPGTGSSWDFLQERTANVAWPDLRLVLGDVPFAVVGAVATRLYMPERATQDLHVLVAAADAPRVRQRLAAAGWVYQGELAIGGSAWRGPSGEQVDVLEGNDPWVAASLSEAQTNPDLQGLPILSLPYLILMKLAAGRVQDLADIARMLGQANAPALDRVRQIVGQYRPADLEDVESLIELGRLERPPAE
ncbi:MAG: hypothetical protein HY320_05935 [Armatimonadetes bacterium]|nr:hypothetical protein [Armatimonadota bacterium]